MFNLKIALIMLHHSICLNGIEVSNHTDMHDYITAQNAILGSLSALKLRWDFSINTYTFGEDQDRCLSIVVNPLED